MRSHLEFRSPDLFDGQPDADTPKGEAVARLLAEQLPNRGFHVEHIKPEDWGWRVQVSHDAFPLWIGCGHYEEYPDGHLCFIEPSKPYVRRWLKRVATAQIVEQLAAALEQVIRDSDRAYDLRWWTTTEVERG